MDSLIKGLEKHSNWKSWTLHFFQFEAGKPPRVKLKSKGINHVSDPIDGWKNSPLKEDEGFEDEAFSDTSSRFCNQSPNNF
jgi:hypothetical protein